MSPLDPEIRILLEQIKSALGEIRQALVAIGKGFDEDRDTKREAANAREKEEPSAALPTRVSIQLDPSLTSDLKHQETQRGQRDTKRRVTELIALAAVIAYSIVALLQWQEMNVQSRNSATAIEKSISDSINNDRAIKKQLSTAQQQADAASEQATAAQDAVVVMRESLKTQERAWVGVTGFNLVNDIKVGNKLGAKLTLLNSGRSPAIHVRLDVQGNVFCGAFPKVPPYAPQPADQQSVTILLPGVPTETPDISANDPMGPEVDKLRSSNCNIYTYARIRYDDTFGHSHWRHVCGMWQKNTSKSLTVCSSYNDGDEDYPDGKEPQ